MAKAHVSTDCCLVGSAWLCTGTCSLYRWRFSSITCCPITVVSWLLAMDDFWDEEWISTWIAYPQQTVVPQVVAENHVRVSHLVPGWCTRPILLLYVMWIYMILSVFWSNYDVCCLCCWGTLDVGKLCCNLMTRWYLDLCCHQRSCLGLMLPLKTKQMSVVSAAASCYVDICARYCQ